jgi:predicted enzyme involved in methoxymalonyl-ACP biosynthesis
LINKTNQYNTTGRRWSPGELGAVLARGGFLLAASVGDQFTDYGIVAVAVVSAAAIVQFVMSCRVFGMEIEFAVISMTIEMIRRRGYEAVTAQLTETGKNALCLGLYRNSGFTETNGGKWEISPVGQISMPRHIRIAEPATEPA